VAPEGVGNHLLELLPAECGEVAERALSVEPPRPGHGVDEGVEQAHRTAIERGTAYTPPEPARTPRSLGLQADMQIDMEAEP
jgi:hypothetical protein